MRTNYAFMVWIVATTCWIGGCSQTVEGQLEQARNDLKIGKYAPAKKAIDEIVAVDSTTPEAIYGKALLDEYRSLEWDALLKHLEAAKLRDGFIPSIDAFTRLAIKLKYLENARRMDRIYIDKQPDNPAGYLYMAKINVLDNQLDSARAYMAQAPASPEKSLDMVLAEAEIALHSYDEEAINNTLAKLADTPFKTSDQLMRLASLYHYLNMGDSAISCSRRAVEEDSDNLRCRLQLAQYLFDERRLAEAEEIVAGITTKAKEFNDGWVLSAYIQWALGDKTAAEKDFYNYLGSNSASPIPLEKHGDLYQYFDEQLSAATDFEAAYVMANNSGMPDDYIYRLFLKMMNGFLGQRNFAMAIDYFKEGSKIKPGTVEDAFLEAELKSHFAETADSAKMMVDDRLDQFWDDARWLEMAGRYFVRRNQPDQALKVYTRLTQLPYPKLEDYLNLLDLYQSDGDINAVDQLADQLPFRFRGSRRLQEKLLDIYTAAGENDKAVGYAEMLYHHSSEYLPYVAKLAALYSETGRGAEGRQLLVKYTDQFPKKADGQYQLAKYDFQNGQMETVPSLIEGSLALDSGYAFSMELMGQYLQATGKDDSAAVWYDKAIRLNWPTPMAFYNLSDYLYNKQTDLNRAATLALAAVRYMGVDPRAYLLAGRIYYDLGNFKTAKLNFTKGKHLFPDDPLFRFYLGKTEVQLQEKADAKAELNKALELKLPSPYKEEAQKLLSGL